MTRHIGIREKDFDTFIKKLDEVCKSNVVFATQTHIEYDFYIAICFIKEWGWEHGTNKRRSIKEDWRT